MRSVSPIILDLGEWPWRSAVSRALATIQEDDEYEDLVASFEDPGYPNGRAQLVGDLGTAVICLRLLLVLWRMPGRRDDDALLAEGNLWLWLRDRALLCTEFPLGIEAPSAMRRVDETTPRETVDQRRAGVAQQIRALIPKRPRTIGVAQQLATGDRDYPLDEALDLLESLCAELGVYLRDTWYLGQAGRFGDLGNLISELGVRRQAWSPIVHVLDLPAKHDAEVGEEIAKAPLEELITDTEDDEDNVGPFNAPRAVETIDPALGPARSRRGRPAKDFNRQAAYEAVSVFVCAYGNAPTPLAVWHSLSKEERGRGEYETWRKQYFGKWSKQMDWPRPSIGQ